MDSPLITIETSQIGEDGLSISGEVSGDLLDLVKDPLAQSEGPVHYDLTVENTGQDLIVRGVLEAPIRVRCSRCAQFFSTTARVSSFLHAYDWVEHPDGLDISTDVREDLLLEISAFPLCNTECKGLCAQCGQDLNEGPCGCVSSEEAPSPWSALDGLIDSADSRTPTGGGESGRTVKIQEK